MSIQLRPLEIGDYEKGFFDVLAQLTSVEGTTKEKFVERFHKNQQNPRIQVLVGEKNGKIVCTGSLLVEEKYIHGCRNYGHIEDIAVDHSIRKTGVGKHIILTLLDMAKKADCFCVSLTCSDENVPFYQKCGLDRVGNDMLVLFE